MALTFAQYAYCGPNPWTLSTGGGCQWLQVELVVFFLQPLVHIIDLHCVVIICSGDSCMFVEVEVVVVVAMRWWWSNNCSHKCTYIYIYILAHVVVFQLEYTYFILCIYGDGGMLMYVFNFLLSHSLESHPKDFPASECTVKCMHTTHKRAHTMHAHTYITCKGCTYSTDSCPINSHLSFKFSF